MAASTAPRASSTRRRSGGAARSTRHGRRQSANTTAAAAIRSQATPSTPTCANSSTASDGPRKWKTALVRKNELGGSAATAPATRPVGTDTWPIVQGGTAYHHGRSTAERPDFQGCAGEIDG